MRVTAAGSAQELACAAADWTLAHLQQMPRQVLALPTGQTPLSYYAELVARSRAGRLSLGEAVIFNLDEYCGLAPADPHSYAAFLQRHLIAPLQLPPAQVRLLRGDAADGEAECLAYDAALAACGGIDLCILGLGANGHIAFNEPGTAWNLRTHLVDLSEATRSIHASQSMHAWTIPPRGMTMGIQTILEARHILLLIAGANKKAARQALHRGAADADWPVTSLLTHPCVTAIELS